MFTTNPQNRARPPIVYASQKPRQNASITPTSKVRRPPGPRPWPFMFTAGLFSMILPATGLSLLYLQRGTLFVPWTFMASMLSLAMYVYDKRQALTGGWRVKESWLLITDIIGGWPGGFVGQWWCRHKVRKTSYQLRFWTVVLLHNIFWSRKIWYSLHLAYFGYVSRS